jgi:hypothetical protein
MQVLKKRERINCAHKNAAVCMAQEFQNMLEVDPKSRIPFDYVVFHVKCLDHERLLKAEGSILERNLGQISKVASNYFEKLEIKNGYLQGVRFKAEFNSLYWEINEACPEKFSLYEAICRESYLDEFISDFTLDAIILNRFFISQLILKNEEYIRFRVAFHKKLSKIDKYGAYEIQSSGMEGFFRKCLNGIIGSKTRLLVTKEDTPIFDPFRGEFNEICKEGEFVDVAKIKMEVARVSFRDIDLYVKNEKADIDPAVQSFYSCLNYIFPSKLELDSQLYTPEIATYGIVGLGELSIKEAALGIPLIQWDGDLGVADIQKFAISFITTCLGGYIIGVNDRHGNNIFISKEKSLFTYIDNKYCLGAKPLGLDSYGSGMVPSLKVFLDKHDLFPRIERIGMDLFHFLANSQDKVVTLAKICFFGLRESNDIESFIKQRLSNSSAFLESLQPALQNVTKNVKQGGMQVLSKEIASSFK